MWLGVVSLFPQMFDALTGYGITGRAVQQGLCSFHSWNPRDYTRDLHRTVDDRSFGGGPGMVMKYAPVQAALQAGKQAAGEGVKTVYLSPQGRPLTQAGVTMLAAESKLLLLCGRYEGVDERLIEAEVDEEWSLGDFVLSGGEPAAIALLDAVIRLQPGALNHAQSAAQDSFSDGLLDYPHYTRPETIDGHTVPEVLRSGDHEKIRRWRLQQALGRTWLRRPDLLAHRVLTEEEKTLLGEFQRKNLPEPQESSDEQSEQHYSAD